MMALVILDPIRVVMLIGILFEWSVLIICCVTILLYFWK